MASLRLIAEPPDTFDLPTPSPGGVRPGNGASTSVAELRKLQAAKPRAYSSAPRRHRGAAALPPRGALLA
eukprot:CAMPEP_0171120768 /NCGR_PEP_ID=MMETSP0766_2-20121228/100588_1 /TAXON_ID=439317 /ORGANISM="Gambierdiscus australes, Strain CAWD 149" /LENGTH=69 /DNA_ID=CAMNT_0011583517 /DNA_START=20 /DNA_END=226 /DNA_ORIENTATION=+